MCLHQSTPAPVSMLNIALANLTPADARFLTDVIAVFADPAQATFLEDLRAGRVGIAYGRNGDGIKTSIDAIAPPSPQAIVSFMARFTEHEWEQIRSTPNLQRALFLNLDVAETLAREALGYLPHERPVELANG